MKFKHVLLGLLTFATIISMAYAATIPAPTSFLIAGNSNSNVTNPTTQLYMTWTNGAANYDSLQVIRIATDTTFIDMATTTTTSYTYNDLSPHTQYILAIRARRNDSTVVSTKDTMNTAWPEYETFDRAVPFAPMFGARSWPRNSITFDSLYCATSTGLDSTMKYVPWKYTSIQAEAIGAADSCKVLLKIFCGNGTPTNIKSTTITNTTGTHEFKNVAPDSINITQAGWTVPRLLNIPPCQYFYVRADGQTDNGNATKVQVRLYRNRD